MATFRCKRSGNTISFTNENDIRGLRAHEGYTEVLNEEVSPKTETSTSEALPAFFGEVQPSVQEVQSDEVQVLKKTRRRRNAM